jgi:hypothetical protein
VLLILPWKEGGLDGGEDVALTNDQVLGSGFGVLGSRVFGVDDGVADLDGQCDRLAVVGDPTGASGNNFARLGLFFGGVGDVDPAGRLGDVVFTRLLGSS